MAGGGRRLTAAVIRAVAVDYHTLHWAVVVVGGRWKSVTVIVVGFLTVAVGGCSYFHWWWLVVEGGQWKSM